MTQRGSRLGTSDPMKRGYARGSFVARRLRLVPGLLSVALILAGCSLDSRPSFSESPFTEALKAVTIEAATRAASTPGSNSQNAKTPAAGTPNAGTPGPAPILSQGFENIAGLMDQGWTFLNKSNPPGSATWRQAPIGAVGSFLAQSGSQDSYVSNDYFSTMSVGTISDWMLTPPMPLKNGAVVSFWTRTKGLSASADRLEVRFSTAGNSADVGKTELDVGVFTRTLVTVNPTLASNVYPKEWTQFTATLSGLPAGATGRIAFRYFVVDGGPNGTKSSFIGVDTVQVLAPATP